MTQAENILNQINNILTGSTALGSVTKTQVLSTTAPLSDTRACKAVMLFGTVTITTGQGTAITVTGPITLPCANPSDILVSGSGTLSYIIFV